MSAATSKRVLIGVPLHKNDCSASTVHSITQAQGLHQVNFQLLGLSLLAKNFNLLFISAWEKGFDYFVLHHSDLACMGTLSEWEGTWVDLLVHRMEETEAAAISAIVPIKTEAGLTSTALEMVRDDPYSMRRLTIMESNSLPLEYINRADLCEKFQISESKAGALLINTGLMIMNLRGIDWAGMKWPGFNIEDKIVWNKSGVPDSFTTPEDWGFSRWLHAQGLPYFATRELVVAHVGPKLYENRGEWGAPTDGPRQQPSIHEWEQSTRKRK